MKYALSVSLPPPAMVRTKAQTTHLECFSLSASRFASLSEIADLTSFPVPGYREFHNYLDLSNPADKDFQTALNNMKTSTRQYAKKQISWLRNKLLPTLYTSNDNSKPDDKTYTYLLDATGRYQAYFLHSPE